ncbi:hypothetical protein K438DRAFT_1777999 [Mycena galopus ATCC 62051]|nr:hypothetical protein K438DRAFT_1777999 [Mycena galopus ATCC 62051]
MSKFKCVPTFRSPAQRCQNHAHLWSPLSVKRWRDRGLRASARIVGGIPDGGYGGQTARIVGGMPDGGLGCSLSRWTQWRGLQGGKSAKTFNTTMHKFHRKVS